jgi:hypothetical protein
LPIKEKEKKEEYLSGPDKKVTETKDMLLITTNFYKKLFGYKEKLDIHLSEYFWEVGVLVESTKIS